jgi:predicted transcriptional regulator
MENYLVRVPSTAVVKLNNAHVLDKETIIEHDDFLWCFPEDAVKKLTHVDTKKTIEEVEKTFIISGHTRLPVIKEDKVIGILNSKEFLS